MRDRLPPLFSLQAFEAAARLGNFSRAAGELHLTPGAISRQVRQLEDWCGQTLFERVGNQMRLTVEGRELLARLGGPLAALHEAVYPEPEEAHTTLQIATLGSLARAWLLPRLHGFIAAAPTVRLIVQTDYALVRPPPRVALVALRHGRPEDGGEILFGDRLLAVAAPALARQLGRDATRWPAARMLSHVTGDAPLWLAAAGTTTAPAGPAFNDAAVTLDAAEAGLGVAVTRLSLALPRLRAGTLVQAHELLMPSPRANLLVIREDAATLPVVKRFATWLREEARQTSADLKAWEPA
ncbi:LysR family glycine cleavage system transcriptional activator [Pelomonas saccharophila]|uniref:LysR family glycine cleavage system transcriptional activator n=1 Tax=Roseateles saccharophilus TaxID=304 RepID=A0ABU1YLI6_ROSSA|nr:LysR family transcriptional regulator [Roseateles saccharophilus]MDR7269710.1 LysR family glycine cleavage system transcriptional activator [Roseateles saccharophilus]